MCFQILKFYIKIKKINKKKGERREFFSSNTLIYLYCYYNIKKVQPLNWWIASRYRCDDRWHIIFII